MRNTIWTYKFLVVILLIAFYSSGYSQSQRNKVFVLVLDKNTSTPINAVYISNINNTKYVTTEENGRAEISFFHKNDTLIFQRANYYPQKIAFENLKSINYKVLLINKNNDIKGVTIFANKWEQKQEEFPYTTRGFKAVQIINNQASTSADIMGQLGEVFVQKSQNGGGSPMIRGFAANGVLIVVNNVRMNNAIFRSGNLQNIINIQPAMINNTEVIYGPGSVTYGSDAMGGVMDFHLKSGKFSTNKKTKTSVAYTGMVSTSPSTMNHNLDVNIGMKKFASRTVLTYYEYGSVIAGKNHYGDYPEFGKRKWVQDIGSNGQDTVFTNPQDNKLTPSSYNSYGLLQNFSYKINDDILLSYNLVYSNTSNIKRYDKLISESNGLPKYAQWYYGPQKWVSNSLTINYNKKNSFFDQSELVISNQQFEESRHDRKFQKNWINHRTEKVIATGLNADFNKDISKKLSVFYGLELIYNNVNSSAYQEEITTKEQKPTSTRYPDDFNHYFTTGIYINSKYKYAKNITFLSGIRLSAVNLSSGFTNTFNSLPMSNIHLFDMAPNGSIGMAWVASTKLLVNVNISSAFRAPNIDDVSKIFDSEPGSVVVPNPNLKSEYSYSTEGSIIYKPTNFISLGGSVFYTYVDNIMVRRDYTFQGADSIMYDGEMSKVQAITNAAHGYIYGSNLNIKINMPYDIIFKSDLTLMRGMDDQGNILRHIPPTFGRTTITYKHKDLWVDFDAIYSGGIAFENLAPEEQGKTDLYSPAGAQSWFTLNIKSGIKFKKGVSLVLSLNNILDRFYIPYASGIASPGRNINLTLHVQL